MTSASVPTDERYGDRLPWHDVQPASGMPAVGDGRWTFPGAGDLTPLDHRNPWRARLTRRVGQPRHPSPLPPMLRDLALAGLHAVQVLRTYPAKRRRCSRRRERSIACAWPQGSMGSSRLVYLEDQYLQSEDVAQALADVACTAAPELRLIVVETAS